MLLLGQLRRLLRDPAARAQCWLMLSPLPSRMPRASSAELLPRWAGPSWYHWQQLFLPSCMDLAFVLAELCMVPVVPFLWPLQGWMGGSPALESICQLYVSDCPLQDRFL